MQGMTPRFIPPLGSFFGFRSCTLICGLFALAALSAFGFVLISLTGGFTDACLCGIGISERRPFRLRVNVWRRPASAFGYFH
jgi:hypothetical protein